jgi:hypothetical protein
MDTLEGPPLRFTLSGYDSQNWVFKPEWLGPTVAESCEAGTREIFVEVGIATGKPVRQSLRLDDYFNSDEIARLTKNS